MSDPVQSTGSAAEIFGSNRMWGLKELPLPDPIGWWPQTAGWYLIAGLAFCAAIWIGWVNWRKYQRNAYRRAGLAQLNLAADDPRVLRALPFLLRKSALDAAPRADVAGLRGSDWIDWLNQSAGRDLFLPNDAAQLEQLAYGRSPEALSDEMQHHLLDASRIWMRSHNASV